MVYVFPESLAPNFFHVDKLPDYGLTLHEDELGREIRRYTEDTGYKTELKVEYTGLRSADVKALSAFYLEVKGSYDKFTLPNNFYRSPSSITTSLGALADTTEWRFVSPPVVQTVISDIYTAEIRLVSLKDELNPESGKVLGFVTGIDINFRLPVINIPLRQIREISPVTLTLDVPTIFYNQKVSVASADLEIELGMLSYFLFAGVTSNNILFNTPVAIPTALAQTGGIELNFVLPPVGAVALLDNSRSVQGINLTFLVSQVGFGNLDSFEQMPSVIVSGNFTSLARYIHLVDTSTGVASTTLPANAPDDTTLIYSDYSGTSTQSPTGFGLNSFTINAPAGQTIQGQNSRVLNVENTSIQLIKKGNRWTIVGTELATGTATGGVLPLEQMVSTSTVPLTYVSNGDQNDLFYYLGTNELSTGWSNPVTNGRVSATSSTGVGSGGVNSLTNRVFNNNENAGGSATRTIVYDLLTPSFKSNSINILCQRNGGNQTLTLEYSNDNTVWTTVTSGQTVGGDFANLWTRVTYNMTLAARYWRVSLTCIGSPLFYSWAEVQLYGEWIPPTVSNIPLSSNWQGKLVYNNLYSNNFTVTIPDSVINFPVGWFCYLRDDTTNGVMTINPQNTNVVLTSPNGLTLGKDDLYLLIHNGQKSWFIQRLTQIINSVGAGLALNNKVLSSNTLIDSIAGLIETPSVKAYSLSGVSKFGFTVNNISLKTATGTCTVTLQINGVSITGLNNISVSSTNQTVSATNNNIVTSGQELTLVVSNLSSPTDLLFSIEILRS